ncbi:MAG: MoaD/ThiS family protein [Candidatus Desulfatibia sp.]|jgi:adenylyltransferase/sulfurtransferase|uniref:MoaD/ThiS family protein n=1 Tax=Candidatus Desulfatibia sp. TaxID=3101189 RepID=UPI002F2E5CC0
MIAVKISFLSLLKDRIGVKELNMDLEDESTINDVFAKLFEKYGEDIEKLLIKKTGDLNDQVVIMLNEKSIRSLDNLDTKIRNNDEIILLPAIAGG